MKGKHKLPIRVLILSTLLVSGMALAQDGEPQSLAGAALAPLSTDFTYQGRLDQNGSPVNDACDMSFRLYDAASMGTEVGSDFHAGVPIVDGLFSVVLDFGAGAFDGERRWLEIKVDCEEDGTYDDLGRQELTAAPYALYAAGAPWSGLGGVPAGFADGVDDDTTYTAGEGLVLDGTEFSAQGSPYANVVVVAQSGGDYTSVQAAIDSIIDAAEDNAYLVWVAPGVYSETVTMKPYVHLQGAGQEATIITSTVTNVSSPPSQATLVLTRSTSLRDLTVGNGGTGSRNAALLATDGTTRTVVADVTALAHGAGIYYFAIFLTGGDMGIVLQNVTGLAENGSGNNFGLYISNGTAATLRGGSFTGRGGSRGYGIYTRGSNTTLKAEGVNALGENGGTENFGLYNYGWTATMLRGGSFTARGAGSDNRGIYNYNHASLKAEGVTALAENGSNNYGMDNYSSAEATLRGGSFTGRGGNEAYGIYSRGSGTMLEATGVTALAENGSFHSYGLYNYGGAGAMLRGGSFTARGELQTWPIRNSGSGTRLEATSVTALGESGSISNCGLDNREGAAALLHGGSFTGRGENRAYGIWNIGSGTTLEATGVTGLAENGVIENYGLYNHGGAGAVLNGGFYTGRGGGKAYGIYNSSSATTLEATGVTGLGENGSASYGLANFSANVEVDSSRFAGSDNGLYLVGGTVYLGVTQLDGGADKNSGGTLTCFQVYDENYAPYTCP